VEYDWRGFELHPEIPPGGRDLSTMFPSDQIEMFSLSINRLAVDQGVGEMILGKRAPNTRAALAVAEYARDHKKLFPFKDAMMAAYWRDGLDIEDDTVVTQALQSVGLDVVEGLAAGVDDLFLERVDAMRIESHAAGVTGIPTMIFDSGEKIVGAQRWEVFVDTANHAGISRR
jgi:predicted DsbA family dithiol-disulfide isomerase